MSERQVLAVFDDEQDARQAASALRRAGVGHDVRVGSRRDEQASLQSEMQEEMEHTFLGPGNVGPFTREMAKGAVLGTFGVALVGAVAALPFGLIDFGPELWQRLLIAAFVGGFAGATLGFVVGGGFAATGPAEPLAAERGVTVSVTVAAGDEAERAARTLAERHAIRVDVTDETGRVVDVVATELDRRHGGVVRHVVETLEDNTEGDWQGARRESRRS
jgi:hypothetical protein